jgi:glycosyltransferase involved in cell wall biosynthesis
LILTFCCPSDARPVGGVTVLYELANGMRRRGHTVRIAHLPAWGRRISSVADLSWFSFEPGIEHFLIEDRTDPLLPSGDVVFDRGFPDRLGRPVIVIQGVEMVPVELERAIFRSPGLKVCVASWLIAEVVRRYGVEPAELVHVPLGIDHGTFRVTTPIEERPPQVGLLSNPHPAKGWLNGLRALELAHAQVPHMGAVVFGTHPAPDVLPPWATYVENPGPRELAEEVYGRCSVFLQPSQYEGFGFTAVEAMACGCALVSTDNGGSRDYAFPAETALVAAPSDVELLGEHVASLLRHEELRHRLARAGMSLVQGFRWDRTAEVLEGHLARYLAEPGVASTA